MNKIIKSLILIFFLLLIAIGLYYLNFFDKHDQQPSTTLDSHGIIMFLPDEWVERDLKYEENGEIFYSVLLDDTASVQVYKSELNRGDIEIAELLSFSEFKDFVLERDPNSIIIDISEVRVADTQTFRSKTRSKSKYARELGDSISDYYSLIRNGVWYSILFGYPESKSSIVEQHISNILSSVEFK